MQWRRAIRQLGSVRDGFEKKIDLLRAKKEKTTREKKANSEAATLLSPSLSRFL